MHPMVGSIPANVVGWGIAAALGGGSLVWLTWRAGMHIWQITVTFVVMAVSLFVGSKLLYLVEARSEWRQDPEAFWRMLVSAQMRIPGGILLAILVMPPLARLLRALRLVCGHHCAVRRSVHYGAPDRLLSRRVLLRPAIFAAVGRGVSRRH